MPVQPSGPKLTWTLGRCKDWLRARIEEGEHCPCCHQFAKQYRRRIHTTMAATLIYAHQHFDRSFFHLSLLDGMRLNGRIVRQADFPKLCYWGLLEKAVDIPEYRITELGVMWVRRQARVPEIAVIYDGALRRLEGEPITIVEALKAKFDYAELMSPGYTPPVPARMRGAIV